MSEDTEKAYLKSLVQGQEGVTMNTTEQAQAVRQEIEETTKQDYRKRTRELLEEFYRNDHGDEALSFAVQDLLILRDHVNKLERLIREVREIVTTNQVP